MKARPHSAKKRLDVLLVERGLVESRQKAQAVILAGEVRVERAARGEARGDVFRRCADRVSRARSALRQPRRGEARRRACRISA